MLRFTVAVPPEQRSTLLPLLRRELRQDLAWSGPDGTAEGTPDASVGVPEKGRFVHCESWPGAEGAAALVEAGWQRLKDQENMRRLNEIGRALASEHNLDKLLDLILTQARELLAAEAGSIYLVVEDSGTRVLLFAHTQNSKVSLPYHRFRMPISPKTLAGYVAYTGEALNLADVYEIPESAPFRFNDSFDRQAGYRTQSMLGVPMVDRDGEVLGAIQFINRVAHEDGHSVVVPFSEEQQALAQSLAGQAGVALKNAQLREEIERLFDGFVNASVTAIESRDPATSGHSGRVADLTVGLAEAVNRTPNGIYGDLFFTDKQIRELRYASLLHDFGKVGVREQVLVKAKKLETERLELILQRLRQRDLELAVEQFMGALVTGHPLDLEAWRHVLEEHAAETERFIDLVKQSNEPTVLTQEVAQGLDRLAELKYRHWNGEAKPLVDAADLVRLNIKRGSLSPEERLEIESHVTHTYRFLKLIPWTRDLSGVPEIAYAHHEKLTGNGYPRQLHETEIPVQAKAMTISDIYDALTAQDRPYKAAVPVPKSLAILEEEAKSGHIDRSLLDLFIEAKVFERTVKV